LHHFIWEVTRTLEEIVFCDVLGCGLAEVLDELWMTTRLTEPEY
jgi:hypothetical protein